MGSDANQPDPDKPEANAFTTGDKLPELSATERAAINRQSRPSAVLIHETIRAEGESELEREVSALLLSGLAAGLSMGLSLVVQALLRSHLPEAPWRDLVAYLGYTTGFFVVVMGRQQLFTENTLTPILPLLRNRDAHTFGRVLRLWAAVLAANMAGAWAFAAAIAHTEIFGPDIHLALSQISHHAIASPFWTTLVKAIFAGWLIALMVWLLPSGESARPAVILLVTYIVALAQLAHIVAGAVDVFYLVETGAAGGHDFLARFFVPTLLGNVLGGTALVAALNYGQVAPEIEDKSS